MLNQLQLWNVRATFDVTWNQLHKTFPMLVTSTTTAAPGGPPASSMMNRNNLLRGSAAIMPPSNSISDREQIVITTLNQKEQRPEAQVLSDCFNTTAFENQARCSMCPKSLSVYVNVKMFRSELMKKQKDLAKANNLKSDTCHDCGRDLPSCAVCF